MQSGKDSACNLLYCIALKQVLKLTDVAFVDDEGRINIEYTDENGKFDAPLMVDSRNPEFMAWMAGNVWPLIRKFSFAEPLKEFCQNVLGLSEESVWGTMEQKNKPTHLRWEDMPTVLTITTEKLRMGDDPRKYSLPTSIIHEPEFMTGREVMEYFGSQICRKMYNNVWADALVRKINLMNPAIATVCDVRFPNEVEAIKNVGGKVIRLTRICEEAATNKHISNTALDDDVYDWSNFDAVIDNQNLTMKEAHDLIIEKCIEWEIMELKEVEA